LRGTSRLSPYLHFGNIGPVTIALAVKKAVAEGKATEAAGEKYLDELIGWRELAVCLCATSRTTTTGSARRRGPGRR
jgi:deoxyribodipyrimidine photo-lyase